MQDAYEDAINREKKLFSRQTEKLDDLISSKEDKLYNLGNIFDRFESTGAFGDTDTLKDLRQAQSDFSALAAGDFSGFESQLRKSMSDALIATMGSGSPVGAFAGLAADTQMAYRQQGLQTAIGVTEFLSNESFKLLGSEFGIMDQGFQTQYELDRTKVSNINNYSLGAASQEGVALSGFGNALSQFGGSVASYGMYQGNLAAQQNSLASARGSVSQMLGMSRSQYAPAQSAFSAPVQPRPVAQASLPSSFAPTPSLPNFSPYHEPFDQFNINPFSYGSGYQAPSYAPSYGGGVLPAIGSLNYAGSQVSLGY